MCIRDSYDSWVITINFINQLGQLQIPGRQTCCIMRGQDNGDAVIDIAPLRMVIEFFGMQGNLGHKAKGLIEILKSEIALDQSAALATGMFDDALRAFAERNAQLAIELKGRDKELDRQNREFTDALVNRMRTTPRICRPI